MIKASALVTTILILFFFGRVDLNAQGVKIVYKESGEDFSNPERGFYIPSSTKASDFILLSEKKLMAFQQEQQSRGASYKVHSSLLYRSYELDTFKDKPLSVSFLENLQKDFDAVRKAGLKMILRFAYTDKSHTGDCKDEYGICPPYGDAPVEIVLHHVKQLQPYLYKNADVIAVLQEGFIGIWGENYYTDYFGSGTNEGAGIIADSSWGKRNKFLAALLAALPLNRMIQVRTPQIKQKYVYGVKAVPSSGPLTVTEAFSKKDKARIGFHNDCFLSSPDDYNTYYDYGSSAGKRDTANKRLRNYIEADSRFVPVGGETCDDAFSPQNDCAPSGYATEEMAAMHYSFLNAAYNNTVNNDWDSLGCMESIKRKLGYRLLLHYSMLPAAIKMNDKLQIQIQLENKGYASPYNPRPVQLILRNRQTGKIARLNFSTQIQKWFTGMILLKGSFALPASLPKGEYDLLLNLPDAYQSLQNPAYSIRLANEDVWEPGTGFNSLHHYVKIS
jgi:hypothetical protein